ncbi:MAG: type I methionyl aminopeptidase [Saprospiraceae bacterium]|nr:type I methionyl aminopeptidase [Saprospiraceae bacterium]
MFQSSDKKEIYYKTDEEVELIREACILNCQTIAYVGSLIKPGLTGKFLDEKAEEFIRDHNAVPAFKGYGANPFPNTLTISVNEQVVHGIPSNREFLDTDIVSVDCGVMLNGYFGDAAYTYAMPNISSSVMKLLQVTKLSLYKGIEQAIVGKRIGDIGFAIFELCEKQNKFGVVRDLIGHGLGKNLHEDPDVPNHGKRGNGVVLRKNLVIAIEPMINMGTKDVYSTGDGWTIITKDRKPSAHYEHTIAVRPNKAEILSDHSFIEEAEKKNENILAVTI